MKPTISLTLLATLLAINSNALPGQLFSRPNLPQPQGIEGQMGGDEVDDRPNLTKLSSSPYDDVDYLIGAQYGYGDQDEQDDYNNIDNIDKLDGEGDVEDTYSDFTDSQDELDGLRDKFPAQFPSRNSYYDSPSNIDGGEIQTQNEADNDSNDDGFLSAKRGDGYDDDVFDRSISFTDFMSNDANGRRADADELSRYKPGSKEFSGFALSRDYHQ